MPCDASRQVQAGVSQRAITSQVVRRCRPVQPAGDDKQQRPGAAHVEFIAPGNVPHLRYTFPMKTATIPSVRVEPEFRAEVEAVLTEGETLSEFVEASVRANVERRRIHAEFIARGLRSRDEARRTGDYVDADVVIRGLQRKLDAARSRVAKSRK